MRYFPDCCERGGDGGDGGGGHLDGRDGRGADGAVVAAAAQRPTGGHAGKNWPEKVKNRLERPNLRLNGKYCRCV